MKTFKTPSRSTFNRHVAWCGNGFSQWDIVLPQILERYGKVYVRRVVNRAEQIDQQGATHGRA